MWLDRAGGRQRYHWLLAHGEGVLTGGSFFHLAGYGDAVVGLNLSGSGRVVCLVDPVGDAYACPFAIHDNFLAGNVCAPGSSQRCGGNRSCSPNCDVRTPAVPAPPVRPSTHAEADA